LNANGNQTWGKINSEMDLKLLYREMKNICG
jgi:hypothetical protein